MSIWNAQELADELETIVDRTSTHAVLESLAQVASEKADHIRTNWQDEGLAKEWDKLAARLLNDAMWVLDRKCF